MSLHDALNPEQRAALAEQLGSAKPAAVGLLMSFGTSVRDRREHDHTTQREDWYCLNLAAYMGERVGPVLRRLLDAESRADRYRTAWRLARQRALSLAGAADRASKRARAGQEALQEAVFTILAMQMERDASQVTALREADERLAAMKLPNELKGTLNAGSYADAWRHCRAIVQALIEEKATPAPTDATPAFESLLAHTAAFEIPQAGLLHPLQLRRSPEGGDRWAICDGEGRRWHREHGFVYEAQNQDEHTRTHTRFALAEAWPLAHQIAAGETPARATDPDGASQ